jgi:stage II sporulation protein D
MGARRFAALLLAALVAAACGGPMPPPIAVQGAPAAEEPTVRVWLRSLDGARTVVGKGGFRVDGAVREGPVPLRDGRFEPVGGVFTIDGKHTYAGRLEVRDGKLVNHLPLENYVLGVLRGELPLPRVPRAAAGAQAIAVRSYTLYYLAEGRAVFDVDDTTLYQRYVGLRYAPDDDDLRAGVQATAGLYLAVDDKPLKAYYHSTCGGHTTTERKAMGRNDAPSIRGVPCKWCRASKYWRWRARLTDAQILKAADVSGPLGSFRARKDETDGRAEAFVVETAGATRVRPAGDFRLAVGPSRLRSTRVLAMTRVDGGYAVEGGGWGHGVGLCQMGAIGQGREGRSARDIVAYYYPAATIRRAY